MAKAPSTKFSIKNKHVYKHFQQHTINLHSALNNLGHRDSTAGRTFALTWAWFLTPDMVPHAWPGEISEHPHMASPKRFWPVLLLSLFSLLKVLVCVSYLYWANRYNVHPFFFNKSLGWRMSSLGNPGTLYTPSLSHSTWSDPYNMSITRCDP